jgi:mannose-6-phosphate isomerase
MSASPFRLQAGLHETIWGVSDLEPWFRPSTGKVGEVWFSMPGPEPLPILVKFVFTSARLSIQVHPDDDYALAHEGTPGKTEMQYVLRAEPGAKMAAGFLEPISRERARQAALSGEIEHLVRWFPVTAGQVCFLPPGLVHALGAGITVCEIQQNNPITYRLYDYGRGRELHLDKALDVARLEPDSGPTLPQGSLLASCKYFVVERLEVTQNVPSRDRKGAVADKAISAARYQPDAARFHILVVLEGSGRIGGQRFVPGEAWYVPAAADPFTLSADTRAVLLRTYVP